MTAFKALVSFSGKFSMTAGEVKEIADPAIVKDLKRAGYIEEAEKKQKKAKKTEE